MDVLAAMEHEARSALPADAYDYVAGGAEEERTLREEAAAWARHALLPAAGIRAPDPGETDLSVRLPGVSLRTPVALGPLGVQRMLHPEGECAVARAAAQAGALFCLSTRATTDLADLAAAGGGPRWFQLYADRDRERSERILARAGEHGYGAIVLTVDLPAGGVRDRDRRHGSVALPAGVRMATHLGDPGAAGTKPQAGGWDATLRWPDLGWIARASGLPVVVKGVLDPRDARLAVEHGAAAVVVSTHGGRQLDGALPSAEALPAVVAAVDGAVPVLVDGGIRSGRDVAVALALGAAAVLVARPYAWALAARGEAGVRALLAAFEDDLREAMAQAGATALADLRATAPAAFSAPCGNP